MARPALLETENASHVIRNWVGADVFERSSLSAPRQPEFQMAELTRKSAKHKLITCIRVGTASRKNFRIHTALLGKNFFKGCRLIPGAAKFLEIPILPIIKQKFTFRFKFHFLF